MHGHSGKFLHGYGFSRIVVGGLDDHSSILSKRSLLIM